MAALRKAFAPSALHRRLLDDVAEVQRNPYPNMHLHVDDEDFYKACLILTPETYEPLHLFIEFSHDYPLRAPTITIQSQIVHPNVFGEYICASILNTSEGWTPAYTLKGVLIQLLSFFSSASLEQSHEGEMIDLTAYRQEYTNRRRRHGYGPQGELYDYFCDGCGFSPTWTPTLTSSESSTLPTPPPSTVSKLLALPDEVVLLMLEEMPTKDILTLADTIPSVKRIVNSFDFIRMRELQCFCFKKSYLEAKLGIGISLTGGNRPVLRSEFDLLSQEAFFQHDVRHSVQGVKFDRWLPLPLSRGHWKKVKTTATACLRSIHSNAKLRSNEPEGIDVLYHLMNNVVVQFSADTEKGFRQSDARSTISYASEKAVEAYFSLFHLLLCLVAENNGIIQAANKMVNRFLTGPHDKKRFPDLGHLLVAALISDEGLTQELIFKIIKEAILRNVVWMLDSKGADMAELAYLEPSAISNYRLVKTFEASTTSYRLLMFLKLFSSAARPKGKSLTDIREALFDSHGAPPPGLSTTMARRIRQIREIDGFPGFFRAMGLINVPYKTEFTAFLRRTVTDSVTAGYSVMPLSQSQLYMIRKVRERDVELAEGIKVREALVTWYNGGEKWYWNGWKGRPTFFPERTNTIKRR
ncbi:protein polyubiquitination [Neodidymelliopsis sp. IMI 364377]|nr:protein polyubiquitination [Neodidymelliopsis sp. IMI 364377]